MALYEDRDTQAKQYWQSRLSRERLNISESVEETLADVASQEQWSEEEQKHIPLDRSASSTDLVPPRLSLQSKVLPSVQPMGFVQSVTAEIAAQQATAKEAEGRQKPRNTNILSRFAQRFTSSLAAFGSAMQPDVPTWSPTVKEQEEAFPQERHLATLPSPQGLAQRENVQMPIPTVVDAIPATPSTSSPQTIKSKQRLAGHTGKVRLQTASSPNATPPREELAMNTPTSQTVSQLKEPDVYAWRENREALREPLTVNVRLREKVQQAPSASATETSLRKELQVEHKSSVEKKDVSTSRTSCTTFFGTGAFEGGQSEVMVRNTHTTASSVIHTTLTSNPGPTLVQYISLHPEVGFTLHLTAPVATKTTFNYVLLLDASAETL